MMREAQKNEAAERLHERTDRWPINAEQKRMEHRMLDEALAAERALERAATVERIRRRIDFLAGEERRDQEYLYALKDVDDCLDAEAAR